jgi:hypothetical protein
MLDGAENVAVVEGHLPDPRKASDHAGPFVAEHGPELGQPKWDIPGGARL